MLPALILDSPVDLTPEPPEFESLAALELGNAGAADDGFDAEFFTAVTVFNDGPSDIDSLRRESDAASGALPELAQDETSPITADLALALADGELALGDFERDLNPAGTPTGGDVTGTPIRPNPGGGGGGGGGGEGDGGGELNGDGCHPTRRVEVIIDGISVGFACLD